MGGVGIVGAGPAGLFAANALTDAGVDCEVFERLDEDAVRARARAGVIEDRTARLLDAHGLADGMLKRGKTVGTCEFRRDGRSFVFDYGALSGRSHHIYPQQFLVGDLIDALRSKGGRVRFGTPVSSIDLKDRPVIRLAEGTAVACDLVLGCDGFHGASRAAATGVVCSEVDFGAEWLTLLAEVAPWSEQHIYGLHADGFAGHMHRNPTITRFYLQVEPGTAIDDWDDDAIWSTLESRLGVPGQATGRGPIVERSIMELRSAVTQPMQAGSLYLAGDAAHIVTPAGGKGMNLALQDANELVEGVIALCRSGRRERLDAYSTTRLPQIWSAVEFSHWMLQMLLSRRSGAAVDEFHEGLRAARLNRLMDGGLFAEDFAIAYVGVDK
ncbi:MAG: FAD-dependent monooxygenase [Acidimicrobiaceae bacterium]|nr:FAD-dependent monooxygenase [Acidimicrobiaceae bacterium]